jgi:hypothetical protein
MSDIIEITELDLNDNNFSNSWESTSKPSFGGGIELLMNDKVKDNRKSSSDINLDDLNDLENDLNNLVDDIPVSSFKPKSDLFNSPGSAYEEKQVSSMVKDKGMTRSEAKESFQSTKQQNDPMGTLVKYTEQISKSVTNIDKNLPQKALTA